MPAMLGMAGKGAGAVASAFGGSGKGGPTSTETKVGGSNTTTNANSTATPNLNPEMAGFQSSLVPALSSMYAEASQPVYGKNQIAQVSNSGNAATNAASQALSNNLASKGVLNSGAEAAGQTQLQQGNESNVTGFENQIPLLNQQAELSAQGNVMNLAEGLTGKALSTNTNQGTQNTFGTSSNTTTASGPAFLAGLANNAGGLMSNPGFGSALSGGGKGGKGGGGSNPNAGATNADFNNYS